MLDDKKEKLINSISQGLREKAMSEMTDEDRAALKANLNSLFESTPSEIKEEELYEDEVPTLKEEAYRTPVLQHTEEEAQRAEAEAEDIGTQDLQEKLWSHNMPPKERYYDTLTSQVHSFLDNIFQKQFLLGELIIEELHSTLFILEMADPETKEARLKEKLESILNRMKSFKENY